MAGIIRSITLEKTIWLSILLVQPVYIWNILHLFHTSININLPHIYLYKQSQTWYLLTAVLIYLLDCPFRFIYMYSRISMVPLMGQSYVKILLRILRFLCSPRCTLDSPITVLFLSIDTFCALSYFVSVCKYKTSVTKANQSYESSFIRLVSDQHTSNHSLQNKNIMIR